VVAYINNH